MTKRWHGGTRRGYKRIISAAASALERINVCIRVAILLMKQFLWLCALVGARERSGVCVSLGFFNFHPDSMQFHSALPSRNLRSVFFGASTSFASFSVECKVCCHKVTAICRLHNAFFFITKQWKPIKFLLRHFIPKAQEGDSEAEGEETSWREEKIKRWIYGVEPEVAVSHKKYRFDLLLPPSTLFASASMNFR